MRYSALIVLYLTAMLACSGQDAESQGKKFNASASFSINSNGMNPIPAFSLGKPAVMATLSLGKGRFIYDPGLAYGLDAKPWYIDNWFHYLIINREKFKLRTGVNFSMFFTEKRLTDETVLKGERYWTGEIAAIFTPSPTTYILLSYWSDNGQEHGTLTGHFFNLYGEKSGIKLGKSVKMTASVQLFMISYDGPNDGAFVSPKVVFNYRECHLSLFTQVNQPISTDISPYPGFQWNVGIAYTF